MLRCRMLKRCAVCVSKGGTVDKQSFVIAGNGSLNLKLPCIALCYVRETQSRGIGVRLGWWLAQQKKVEENKTLKN